MAQAPLFAPDFPPVFDVDEQHAAGDIKYGRDASLIMWNCKPHAMEKARDVPCRSTSCGSGGSGIAEAAESCKLPELHE